MQTIKKNTVKNQSNPVFELIKMENGVPSQLGNKLAEQIAKFFFKWRTRKERRHKLRQ